MKWKGIVSHHCHSTIAPKFASANTPQRSSTDLRRRNSVAGTANGLDRRRRAELLSQAPYADVDDVRARIEVVTPDVREQPLSADDLARTVDEVVEQLELAVREVDDAAVEACLPAREVECDRARGDDVVGVVMRPLQLNPDSRQQLIERERLRHVIPGAEPKAPQLRRKVGARREDQHG